MRLDIDLDRDLHLIEKELSQKWINCVRRIIIATTLAKSGHPGGSLSSLHALLTLYYLMIHDPKRPDNPDRDRLILSIGHISPAMYAVLCEYGYFPEEDLFLGFRRAGHVFSGHVEMEVPGVEWNTGNLGQGLSAATGIALALKLKGSSSKVFVHMGDGEQQKGQIAEARRFAYKYKLDNLIGIIDRNLLQIGGSTEEVMPTNIKEEYLASGWDVREIPNGNNFLQLLTAFKEFFYSGFQQENPTVFILRTTMGYGISFMENKAKYHGSVLPPEDAKNALKELGLDPNELDYWIERREKENNPKKYPNIIHVEYPSIDPGKPRVYTPDKPLDCRTAYGEALKDLAVINNTKGEPKIVGFSCDLESSVKMQGFRFISPHCFFESGIQEHHAATAAGAISREGFVTFFSTFGVFAVNETINQHRLNDQNHTHLKVVSTHLGLDVGEDGPTHQAIDYIGILQNLYGFNIFLPADANQTDKIIRYIAKTPGNAFVGMGRSPVPIITKEDGTPFFDENYTFIPGKIDVIRSGKHAVIFTYGTMLSYVLNAYELLKRENISVTVINTPSIKPLNRDEIIPYLKNYPILTVEDHNWETGLGGIIKRILAEEMITQKIKSLGVKNYGGSGTPKELFKMQGLDPENIKNEVLKLIS